MSVVVPTFNRRDRLHRVLSALAAQDVDEPFEVIVVSDGSTDGTNDYLRSDAVPLPVVTVAQDNQGPAAARNAGIERASGDLVVFVDDDVVAEPGLLRAHWEAHGHLGDRVVVIGPMLDPPDHSMSPWVAWEQAMLAKQYDDMLDGKYSATARQFYTGNASVRTEHLAAVGGFDAEFRRAEDIELAFRLDDLGLTFHFDPEARGSHYADRSYDSWKSAAYLYGRNEVIFARDRGRTWIYQFRSEAFQQHHVAIRWLVRRCTRSVRWRTLTLPTLHTLGTMRQPAVISRAALSCVYAVELHRGMADELGSVETFERLIARR